MIYYGDNEILIRSVEAADIISLFSWQIDKEINRHDPRPLPGSSKELLEECISYCNRFDNEIMDSAKKKYEYFIITNLQEQPIGFVNFFSINREKKQGEMGVLIGDKRYWRKGIAYRAVSEVTNYIFSKMDIKRIYIETGETNIEALGLFDKLGFIKCGEYLEDDDFKFIIMEKKKS